MNASFTTTDANPPSLGSSLSHLYWHNHITTYIIQIAQTHKIQEWHIHQQSFKSFNYIINTTIDHHQRIHHYGHLIIGFIIQNSLYMQITIKASLITNKTFNWILLGFSSHHCHHIKHYKNIK